MENDDFCLAEDTISFIDTKIMVYPVYGWGWDDIPPTFEIRLEELYRDELGNFIGGLGKIAIYAKWKKKKLTQALYINALRGVSGLKTAFVVRPNAVIKKYKLPVRY